MPRAHRLGDRSVSDENRVDSRSEITLDDGCRVCVGADEIAQWTKDRAIAEDAPLLEKSRRRWSESDALSLQTLESIELGAEAGVELFGADQIRACGALPLARNVQCVTRI